MTSRLRGSPARTEALRPVLDAWGVVFCGGASRRMGRDKALLELGGKKLIERAVDTLRALVPKVLLACGERERYGELGLERVLDARPGIGPLAGLLAALETLHRAGIDWCLALACDMPRAEPGLFEHLLARARAEQADACLLATPSGLEPLYAVYRTSALPAVRRAVERGERRLIAFHPEIRVATLASAELPAAFAARDCARNLNQPEEFLAEAALLTGREPRP